MLVVNSNKSGGGEISNAFIEVGYPDFEQLLIQPSGNFGSSSLPSNSLYNYPITGYSVVINSERYNQGTLGGNSNYGSQGKFGVTQYMYQSGGKSYGNIVSNVPLPAGKIVGKEIILHAHRQYEGTNSVAFTTGAFKHNIEFCLLHSDGTTTTIATREKIFADRDSRNWGSINDATHLIDEKINTSGVQTQEGDYFLIKFTAEKTSTGTATSSWYAGIYIVFGYTGGVGIGGEATPIQVSIE